MSEKRAALSLGFTLHMQNLDDAGGIDSENFVNVWGGRYERLEIDEAILFQAALNKECKAEYLALMSKAMDVASQFGLELVGEPKPPGNKPNK